MEKVDGYAPEKSIFSYKPSLIERNRLMNGISAAGFLWRIQSKVIRDLAEAERLAIKNAFLLQWSSLKQKGKNE